MLVCGDVYLRYYLDGKKNSACHNVKYDGLPSRRLWKTVGHPWRRVAHVKPGPSPWGLSLPASR